MKNSKNDAADQSETRKKSQLKKNVFLVIVILLGIAIWQIYSYAQKPAQGAVKDFSPQKEAGGVTEDVPETFSGKYLTFLYDKSYILKTHDISNDDSGIILEQAYLTQPSAISKKIGLIVRNFPTKKIADDPDYQMRLANPKRYKKVDFNSDTVNGISFDIIDQGSFEKTFFIPHGTVLAIITLTAPAAEDQDLDGEVDRIVKSISWLK